MNKETTQPEEANTETMQATPERVTKTGEVLTPNDRNQYQIDLTTCQKHENVFLQIGEALHRINSQRLYREKYLTFRDFLAAELPKLAKSQAYVMINAWELYLEMSDTSDTSPEMLPRTSREVIALNKLSTPEQRREALLQANERALADGRSARQDSDVQASVDSILKARTGSTKTQGTADETNPEDEPSVVEPEQILRKVDHCMRGIRKTLPDDLSKQQREQANEGMRGLLRLIFNAQDEKVRKILREIKKQLEAESNAPSPQNHVSTIVISPDDGLKSAQEKVEGLMKSPVP